MIIGGSGTSQKVKCVGKLIKRGILIFAWQLGRKMKKKDMEEKQIRMAVATMQPNSAVSLPPESHLQKVITKQDCCELSIYNDAAPTEAQLAQSVSRLKVAFPQQTTEFFMLLVERVAANGFTAERLKDAVNYTIDNFQYKQINISDVIKFNKIRKFYTYKQMENLVFKGQNSGKDFKIFDYKGTKYWYLENENL